MTVITPFTMEVVILLQECRLRSCRPSTPTMPVPRARACRRKPEASPRATPEASPRATPEANPRASRRKMSKADDGGATCWPVPAVFLHRASSGVCLDPTSYPSPRTRRLVPAASCPPPLARHLMPAVFIHRAWSCLVVCPSPRARRLLPVASCPPCSFIVLGRAWSCARRVQSS